MDRYFVFILLALLFGCSEPKKETLLAEADSTSNGTLFIIGGGSRPSELIAELTSLAAFKTGEYGIVLPMSSIEPDSSAWYAIKQFEGHTNAPVVSMFISSETVSDAKLDSIRNAAMIYIPGGDQRRFMDTVRETGLVEAVRKAYANGAVIAGTSAGAAMMSTRMITGDEKRHPEYASTFRDLQNDNIIFDEGLGLIDDIVVDQHFVKRSRYNRLLTAILEHPELIGVGIDESTAAVIRKDSLRTVGVSQVIIFRNTGGVSKKQDDLIGGRDVRLDILLPGESIKLERAD